MIISTIAVKLPLAAIYRGVLPPCSRCSMLAPAASNNLHISVCPISAEMCIGDCNLCRISKKLKWCLENVVFLKKMQENKTCTCNNLTILQNVSNIKKFTITTEFYTNVKQERAKNEEVIKTEFISQL